MSRREREMMDIVYRQGSVTAVEVRHAMAKPPTDAAVRATLRILVEKQHLRIEQDGPRYVYHPTVPRDAARQSALSHLVQTFFGGSTRGAMAALLEIDETADMTCEDRARMRALIDQAEQEGR
jgi:predicted transcriptional regulator